MKMYTTMTKATFIEMAKEIFSGNIEVGYVNEDIGGISIRNFYGWGEFFNGSDYDYKLLVGYEESPYTTLLDAIRSENPYATDVHNKLNKRIKFLERYGFHY